MRTLLLALLATALASLAIACSYDTCACSRAIPEYRVTVNFAENATQDEIESVAISLPGPRSSLDFVIQETSPPAGVATLASAKGGLLRLFRRATGVAALYP